LLSLVIGGQFRVFNRLSRKQLHKNFSVNTARDNPYTNIC
jgi:hypothetical protein